MISYSGGINNLVGHPPTVTSTVWKFNGILNGQWEKSTPLRHAMGGHSSYMINNQIFHLYNSMFTNGPITKLSKHGQVINRYSKFQLFIG